MCKYCASISSEFEYVNLSDSLSSIGDVENRSPNSDIDRVDPNLLVSAYFGDVLAGHINWSGGNETVNYYIYDSASSLNIDVWNYAGTLQTATYTATTLSHENDSDGVHEVYWKTADGSAYLRSLMHADGNIRYANYQSEEQMKEYLTANGDSSAISDIV